MPAQPVERRVRHAARRGRRAGRARRPRRGRAGRARPRAGPPRRAAGRRRVGRTSAANRAVGSSATRSTVPAVLTAATVAGHVPRDASPPPPPTSPPSSWPTTGEVITYAELDAEANRLSHAASAAPACSRATTSRSAWRTTPASSRSSGARTTPASTTRRISSRLTTRGARLHRQRLRRPGLHHLELQGRPGRRARRPRRRGVKLRLMLDGTIDGYECYEAAVAAQPADAARRGPRRGPRHALLLGHHRPAQGRQGRRCPTRRSARRADGVTGALPAAVRRRRATPSTSRPRRSTTPPRCASAWPRTALGGTVVVMEHFDPEQYLRARRAAPGHRTARWCRRCSSACSSCPTRCAPRYDVSSLQVRRPRRRAVPGARSSSR